MKSKWDDEHVLRSDFYGTITFPVGNTRVIYFHKNRVNNGPAITAKQISDAGIFKQEEKCRCNIRNLMSTGHDSGCMEKR